MLPAGVALAVAIAAAPAAYVLWQHSNTRASAPPFTAAPEGEQAPWKIKTFAAGALSKVGKSERALVEERSVAVEQLVKDVYDAELLDPRELPNVLDKSFARPAATSFAKAGLGVPKGASDVRSTTRSARIGVNVLGGTTAAADVTIKLVGEVKGDKLKMTQHSTLWMQRVEKHWQVVGYDVKQGPSRSGGKGDPGNAPKGNESKGTAP
ncbi:MAG TPA: hypothetical protein VIG64_12190 [Actinomycetota bacterium]